MVGGRGYGRVSLKTYARLGDIGFFTLKKGKYTLYTEEERILGL